MAGLLGIGGGFVVVPILLLVLPRIGIEESLHAHFAIGTSLACIVFTSLSSAYSHHRKKAVNWQLLKSMVPGLIIGAWLGAMLASVIKGPFLILIFVSGALFTAYYLSRKHSLQTTNPTTSSWIYFLYAQFTGIVSALIGIGGGSVLVPFLVYRGQPMVKSVATAAACGFPIALFGSIGFVVSGWQAAKGIENASGFIYWPAFISIVIFSSLSAPLGAKVAHFIQEKHLKQAFSAFLILTSVQIIYSQWFSAV